MVGARSDLESHLNKIKVLVVVALVVELACLYKVVIAPTHANIEFTFELSHKGFSLVDVAI